MVVARGVLRGHDDVHPEFLLQIEEGLLHIADHDGDVVDSRFLQLANHSFYKYFSANLEHGFGFFERKWCQARS